MIQRDLHRLLILLFLIGGHIVQYAKVYNLFWARYCVIVSMSMWIFNSATFSNHRCMNMSRIMELAYLIYRL